jgi:uracil-DNA glycosylase
VVIIGQDPYHNDGQAHGLAFSVPGRDRLAPGSPAVSPPPSLANIFKELRADVPGWQAPPPHAPGDLTPWASEQGVLLLNTALTVRAHSPASHAGRGWEVLTDAVIRAVSARTQHVVFMLWGAHAQKKAALVDGRRHCVLQCAHPSPLSASRGFLGCGHFSKANAYLVSCGRSPVAWSFG